MHDRLKTRRDLPAVGKLIEQIEAPDLPRALVVKIVREQIAIERKGTTDVSNLRAQIDRALDELRRSRLQTVINGTGVIIHTNFGRVPLAAEALRALDQAGRNYNNLEFDLRTGSRGSRGDYLQSALAELCGAESTCVVNNCAAALVLIVRHFTQKKREVVISRGEMIQIGGGFRIGEIFQAAGATLREVGATNKTTLDDYARALSRETGLILKVHRSNFFMSGFVASPPARELATLSRKNRVPFVEDLGSGAISATEKLAALEHEATAKESLRAGADLVCFSGDKLFGGPQAGIIAGKKRFVSALKRVPIFRALRCDKLILSALQATTELHLAKNFAAIPVLQFLRTPVGELQTRAEKIIGRLQDLPVEVRIQKAVSQIGGGAMPRSKVDSIVLAIRSQQLATEEIARRLREQRPAVVGYIARDAFMLDLRTILPAQDEEVARALARVQQDEHA